MSYAPSSNFHPNSPEKRMNRQIQDHTFYGGPVAARNPDTPRSVRKSAHASAFPPSSFDRFPVPSPTGAHRTPLQHRKTKTTSGPYPNSQASGSFRKIYPPAPNPGDHDSSSNDQFTTLGYSPVRCRWVVGKHRRDGSEIACGYVFQPRGGGGGKTCDFADIKHHIDSVHFPHGNSGQLLFKCQWKECSEGLTHNLASHVRHIADSHLEKSFECKRCKEIVPGGPRDVGKEMHVKKRGEMGGMSHCDAARARLR
ncbi:hypothetical protein L218DRAFT_949351 [Marasmius fiardii PR-910]|nr:hypothetical protein L218DRAFT_949351 [Marasmius fiardii PR-910]